MGGRCTPGHPEDEHDKALQSQCTVQGLNGTWQWPCT